MGACTKLKWTRQEGRSIDSLFCHGLISVEAYCRYLREYDSLTRKGIKPRVAVGVLKNGEMDYEWSDRVEIEANGDTFMFGACNNYGCPTDHEIAEMSRSDDNRRIEMARRVLSGFVDVGCVRFNDFDECIDYLSREMEDW